MQNIASTLCLKILVKEKVFWTYNHGWLLEKMRKVCGGDIVCLEAINFVTNYIVLASFLKTRANLKKIFISDE